MAERTPLEELIIAEIRANGPIPVSRYMDLCLAHPTYGYYRTRDPLGAAGDFITAPEISQMFGELIGLWAVDTWRTQGTPDPFVLCELGPGRGTLMADALRAARLDPAFVAAARVHLVETSPVLRSAQSASLAEADPSPVWHDTVDNLPSLPRIIIANEFFDALPIDQFVRQDGRWHARMVGLDARQLLSWGLVPAATGFDAPTGVGAPPDGTLVEISRARSDVASSLARDLVTHGGAVLIVDYGHAASAPGETLQAVRAHRPVDPLDAPGASDLTAHVDFAALDRAAVSAGAAVHGPLEMGLFLESLGIVHRAHSLGRGADPSTRADLEAALHRLTDRSAMGSLFKVLAFTAPGSPAPAPFQLESTRS